MSMSSGTESPSCSPRTVVWYVDTEVGSDRNSSPDNHSDLIARLKKLFHEGKMQKVLNQANAIIHSDYDIPLSNREIELINKIFLQALFHMLPNNCSFLLTKTNSGTITVVHPRHLM